MENRKEQLRRSFGGKMFNFDSNEERNFNKKALKAYLKGHKRFRFGFETINKLTGERAPVWYDTPIKMIPVKK